VKTIVIREPGPADAAEAHRRLEAGTPLGRPALSSSA